MCFALVSISHAATAPDSSNLRLLQKLEFVLDTQTNHTASSPVCHITSCATFSSTSGWWRHNSMDMGKNRCTTGFDQQFFYSWIPLTSDKSSCKQSRSILLCSFLFLLMCGVILFNCLNLLKTWVGLNNISWWKYASNACRQSCRYFRMCHKNDNSICL